MDVKNSAEMEHGVKREKRAACTSGAKGSTTVRVAMTSLVRTAGSTRSRLWIGQGKNVNCRWKKVRDVCQDLLEAAGLWWRQKGANKMKKTGEARKRIGWMVTNRTWGTENQEAQRDLE